MNTTNIKPAEGKLGIMIVGNGAVATTFITGVLMARRGLTKPIGSMTQYDKIRVGSGEDARYLHYSDIVPLASLNDIVFATWDVYPQNAFQAAVYCEVLQEKDILPVKEELEQIVPMPAAFDKNYAKRLDGDNVKQCADRWDMVEQIRADIRRFKAENNCSRIVVLWAASTEIYVPVNMQVHDTLAHLEQAMKADDRKNVAPSMCYAYAALVEGAPFIMGAPNTTVDIPAMWQLAEQTHMPIVGKDFKTGQTLIKSGFSPIISTSGSQAGSLPTFLATGTDWCLTNLIISVPRRSASSPLSTPFSEKKTSQTSTAIITTRCVSTITHHVMTTKKDGTTLTSLVGWVTPCR